MKLGDPHVVGQLMRTRRKQLGFTIEQMAQAVGLSPITIMRIELGRVGYIHAKTAKALEVPKKLTKRLMADSNAVVSAAVTQDNETVVLPPLKVLMQQPPAPRTSATGDVMAIGPTPHVSPNNARTRKPRAQKANVAGPSKAPTLKKALMWLANKI